MLIIWATLGRDQAFEQALIDSIVAVEEGDADGDIENGFQCPMNPFISYVEEKATAPPVMLLKKQDIFPGNIPEAMVRTAGIPFFAVLCDIRDAIGPMSLNPIALLSPVRNKNI